MKNTTHDNSEVFKDGDDEGHDYVMEPRYIKQNYVMHASPLSFNPSTCCCCCCSDSQFPVIDADIYRKFSLKKRTEINMWKMEYLRVRKTNEAAILIAEAKFYSNIAKSLGSKMK